MHYSEVYSALKNAAIYLDPGSGSLIIQLVVAALLGIGLFLRSQWSKVKKLFGIKPAEIDEDSLDE